MPTAAKLVAAILFTVIAVAAALAFKMADTQILPAQLTVPFYLPIMAALGIWQGWMTMGRNAGGGWVHAINTGVRTSFQIGLLGIIVFGLLEMFDRSTRLYYDGPGEAVIAAMDLFMEYGLTVVTSVNSMIVLFGGGVIAALIVEITGRRWS